jgi:poly-gamma-glutamate synthesis protein (capsule biosynthesis protein)
MDKPFVFRGPPHFAKILSYGAVDVVTIANNHTIDFFDAGYRDTLQSLDAEGIAYFGNEFRTVMEINGIHVGLFGFRIWNPYNQNRDNIINAVSYLRDKGAQVIIAFYHWGTENVYWPEEYQRTIGQFSIANGVDLVLGAHPHVVQGIETYRGRSIVYSLGNFSFGGNGNPPDQDTFIFQQTFTFADGVLQDTHDINIIPAFISSTRRYNNFQPTVAEGEEAERILEKIRALSEWR